MTAVEKPQDDGKRQGQRSWTDAQRSEQSARLRARQIWLKSTGPRTPEGKVTSSRNARHADYDYRQAEREEMRKITTYLRTQKSYIDLLRLFIKQEDRVSFAVNNDRLDSLNFLENELIDIERQMFDGMTFYEWIGRANGRAKPGRGRPKRKTGQENVIKFPFPNN